MLALIVALGALSVFGVPAIHRHAPSPCVPDTVEVIQDQILEPDTVYTFNGVPVVTYRVILCVPPGTDLNKGQRPK